MLLNPFDSESGDTARAFYRSPRDRQSFAFRECGIFGSHRAACFASYVTKIDFYSKQMMIEQQKCCFRRTFFFFIICKLAFFSC